jgi:hypothetical protein
MLNMLLSGSHYQPKRQGSLPASGLQIKHLSFLESLPKMPKHRGQEIGQPQKVEMSSQFFKESAVERDMLNILL